MFPILNYVFYELCIAYITLPLLKLTEKFYMLQYYTLKHLNSFQPSCLAMLIFLPPGLTLLTPFHYSEVNIIYSFLSLESGFMSVTNMY